MAEEGSGRGVVEYAASPRSHLWVAMCLGGAGAVLGACAVLGLSEVLASTRRFLLEALFLAS